jgi:DNA polymerase-3 subunit alpha
VGVFQMEGAGMTRHIKELKPSSLNDIAAMIALYRPGPMEHIGTFIDAKHGRSKPRYPHPALEEILEETYGVIVYQDQVLHIVRTFAGYTLGEADIVRKAMGKKIPEIMAQEREKFMRGALALGHSEQIAGQVFALIEPFAGYAFNKAHSVSYGLISYWTAYLKANYAAEYMASLVNAYAGNAEKVAGAVAECGRLKIPVLPPDVNASDVLFSLELSAELSGDGRPAVRFGLAAVKNVGAGAVGPLLEARAKEGLFSSIEHMCRVADLSGLNRKTLESLVKAGAFDGLGPRGGLLEVVDRIVALAQSESRLRQSGQTSMFDLFGESVPTPLAHIDVPDIQTPSAERRAWEQELMGVAFSSNAALGGIVRGADSETIVFRSQIEPDMAGKRVVLAGQVSSVAERQTRDQRPFIVANLELMDGPIEVVIWENLLQETRGLWAAGKLVLAGGTVRVRDDRTSVSCTEASEYVVREAGEDPPQSAVGNGGPASAGGTAGLGEPGLRIPRPPEPTVASPNGPGVADAVPQMGAPAGTGQGLSRRLRLRLRESDQPVHDRGLLEDVSKLLLEYRGEDDVSLEVAVAGRIVTMEWPALRVDACPELEMRLREFLGASGRVFVETAS